ncbi:MAG: hypothetical protein WCD57_08685 [Acidobacteriaceae bacterium]
MPNRAIATLRRAQFDIRVRSSATENRAHGWSLPHQEGLVHSGQRGKVLK